MGLRTRMQIWITKKALLHALEDAEELVPKIAEAAVAKIDELIGKIKLGEFDIMAKIGQELKKKEKQTEKPRQQQAY